MVPVWDRSRASRAVSVGTMMSNARAFTDPSLSTIVAKFDNICGDIDDYKSVWTLDPQFFHAFVMDTRYRKRQSKFDCSTLATMVPKDYKFPLKHVS